jgi:hypothetical protein
LYSSNVKTSINRTDGHSRFVAEPWREEAWDTGWRQICEVIEPQPKYILQVSNERSDLLES